MKKKVTLSVYDRVHTLLPPSEEDIAADKVRFEHVYCGSAQWEIIQARKIIGDDNVIILNEKKLLGAVNFIEPYSNARGDIYQQLVKNLPKKNAIYRIAISNGFGTMLGDNMLGLGALAYVNYYLKSKGAQVEFYPILAWNSRPGVAGIYQYAPLEVKPVIAHSVTFDVLREFDAIIDFDGLIGKPEFNNLNIYDFYLNALGVNSSAVPVSAKKPYVAIPKKKIQEAKARLLQSGVGGELISIQGQASTPLRSMPIDFQCKLLEALLKNTQASILLTYDLPIDKLTQRYPGRVLNFREYSEQSLANYIALIHCCDHVITVDTLASHLCAGIGIPADVIYTSINPDLRMRYFPHIKTSLLPNATKLSAWGEHKVMDWQQCEQEYKDAWSKFDIPSLCETRSSAMTILVQTIPNQAGVNEARVLHPIGELAKRRRCIFHIGSVKDAKLFSPGIFIFHRQFLSHPETIQSIDEMAKNGWLIILDMDDDPRHWKEFKRTNYLAYRYVHAVTVTTNNLKKVSVDWNPNTFVLENQVPELNDLAQKDSEKVHIFFGALNRYDDWSEIRNDVNAVIKKYEHQIVFHVIHDKKVYDELDISSKVFYPTMTYPDYIKILSQCHISLLPLKETQFNLCKSPIKLYESLMCQCWPLASKVVYEDEVELREYVTFPILWGEALEQAIKSSKELQKKIKDNFGEIKKKISLENNIDKRSNLYDQLLNDLPRLEESRQHRVSAIRREEVNFLEMKSRLQVMLAENDSQKALNLTEEYQFDSLINRDYVRLARVLAFISNKNYSLALQEIEKIEEPELCPSAYFEYYGIINSEMNQHELAKIYFLKALSANHNAKNLVNLAISEYKLNNLERSMTLVKESISLEETSQALILLGDILFSIKQYDQCIDQYTKVVIKFPEAEEQLVPKIASSYLAKGCKKQAEDYLRSFETRYPNNLEILNLLGIVYKNIAVGQYVGEKLDYFLLAENIFRKIQSIDGSYLNAKINLASLYFDFGRYKDAILIYKEIINLQPTNQLAILNLSISYERMGLYEEALLTYQSLDKNFSIDMTKHSSSFMHLGVGNLELGWDLYNFRTNTEHYPGVKFWSGESLNDDLLLVFAEQGVGDEIMFASCLNDLRKNVKNIILECDYRLVPLYERSFSGIKIVPKVSPRFSNISKPDYQVSIASLPKYFRRTIDEFPSENVYLVPCDVKKEYWQRELREINYPIKIGVSWTSLLNLVSRNRYYLNLNDLVPIFNLHNIAFVNLQCGDHKNEINDFLNKNQNIKNFYTFDNLDLKDDFDGVAALMTELDLVIGPGTSSVVLAGAVGVECCWLTIPTWTMLGSDANPWAPLTQPFLKDVESSWQDSIIELRDYIRDKFSI